MFIIPCKYTPESKIVQVVNQINKFHTDERILIIDSCSEDQSYMDVISKSHKNVIFAEENKHYVDSATWFAYLTFPEEKHYFVLQDSMEVHKNLDVFKNFEFTSFMWFPVTKEMLSRGRGWHNPFQKNWAKYMMESNTSFTFMEEFIGLFGITFISNREVLTKLYDKGLHKILPSDKTEMCAMERIWGMCLSQIGVDVKLSSIYGKSGVGPTFESEYITKYIFNRS